MTRIICMFAATIGINLALIWVFGSVVTSGIKSFKNECGQTYKVESALGGDWFCSK